MTGSTFESFLSRIAKSGPVKDVLDRVNKGVGETFLHGVAGSLDAMLLSRVRLACDRQMLAIVPSTEAAEELRDDLEVLLGEHAVCYFPDWELIAFEEKSPHVEVTSLRLEALQKLLIGDPVVVVAPISAVLRPTLEPEGLAAASRIVRVGELLDPQEFTRWLRTLSYEPENQVEQIGQYARRGGIVDVFTFGAEQPYRIELFDVEVESIRQFDPGTQRSVGQVEEIEILPRREILSGGDWWGDAGERLEAFAREIDADISDLAEKVKLGIHFDGIEFWGPVLTGEKPSLLHHFDERAVVYLAEPDDIARHAERLLKDARGTVSRKHEMPEELVDMAFHTWEDIETEIGNRVRLIDVDLALGGDAVEFNSRSPRVYEGSLEALAEDAETVGRAGGHTLLLAENDAQARRLEELLATSLHYIDVEVGRLGTGFHYPDARVQIVNDHELFSRRKRRHRYRRYHGATAVKDVFSLTPSDVIVHEDHGIGIYQGLERITLDGVARDCLRILYRDGDKLFVPAEQVNRVQRYSSDEEDTAPVLSKLGGTDWERLKAKTKRGVAKMAEELVKLYAIRRSSPGFRFSEDGHWMAEMEAAFPYEETRDQLRTIQEIKADMEIDEPTDRLVCGDVGYGKTEVAIRAAFKAVVDQKQVAVLVPTTVLAQQHYQTFSERLSPFPVKIAVLSRFRTKGQIEQTLIDVGRGKVDILIGTHRLLSKDVRFHDLGLIIIDEEHRFGVKHKEQLKHMRNTVDVVSMTATPIPRTLQLSLTGVRNMSVITTPPKDRLPVHTEVIPFDADRIAEGILREVDRSGQVFFVHNRVVTIDERAEWLKELLPQIRVRVAHGQMSERQLEKVMMDFMNHTFDVLVCTMIIQSGLDMPNVNTIFVDRADRFGLAELYQLRGRVGRSNHRAFAYLMVPPDTMLNPKARKRLRAIEEHSDLGSGFRVAMRDLEIRGAGNLLGHAQHGFIEGVGFDMYVKMLDEAIREMKGEVVESVTDCEVDMRLSSFLPDDYVADGEQKMELYRKLSESASLEEVDAFGEELKDRYGPLPEPAQALVAMMRIKVLGKMLRADRIRIDRRGGMEVRFTEEQAPSQEKLAAMVGGSDHPLDFRWDGVLFMSMDLATEPGVEQAEKASATLQAVADNTTRTEQRVR